MNDAHNIDLFTKYVANRNIIYDGLERHDCIVFMRYFILLLLRFFFF